jgi:hypothetical protein
VLGFAVSNLHQLLLDIGSYAGLAAILGLAVMSALYFSQARDVKRLREWAGRAPERSAEQQIGGRPATQAAQAAQAAAAARAPSPTPTPGPRPAQPQAPPARPIPGPATGAAQQGAAASPASGGGTATAAPPRPATAPNSPPPVAPRSMPAVGGQTAVLSRPTGASAAPLPWYQRIQRLEPRYLALIAAAVIVIGAGAAYGIAQLTSSSSSSGGSAQNGAAAGGDVGAKAGKSSKPPPIVPSKVTVAVLNGTRIPGLAAQVGDRVQSAGFNLGNVATAAESQKAESVVEFKPGANRQARAVARKLHISQIEPLDPTNGDQSLAGNAQVLVIVGADQQRGSSGGTSGGGTSGGGTGAGPGGATGGGVTAP